MRMFFHGNASGGRLPAPFLHDFTLQERKAGELPMSKPTRTLLVTERGRVQAFKRQSVERRPGRSVRWIAIFMKDAFA